MPPSERPSEGPSDGSRRDTESGDNAKGKSSAEQTTVEEEAEEVEEVEDGGGGESDDSEDEIQLRNSACGCFLDAEEETVSSVVTRT